MSENNYKLSSSPHIRDKVTSSNIMLMVVIALLPASAFGVYNFGIPALIVLIAQPYQRFLQSTYMRN